jgi:hypothetical protein
MKYNDYIKTISQRFKARLDEIATYYNFDLGDEFEIAICKILRVILPEKFGICRGHLVTAEGDQAGDDIIIYNRERFPTLRLLDGDGFTQKEHVPIEAVYAYIEAKHSLIITGKDENFAKAIDQVRRVKALSRKRKEVEPNRSLVPYVVLPFKAKKRPNWPEISNPFFGAILARQVRKQKGGNPLSQKEFATLFKESAVSKENFPDLIVTGEDITIMPFISEKDAFTYYSPFFVEGKSIPVACEVKGIAFAVGICSLLLALDTIRLGVMPWHAIIADALGIELTGE